jgi:hypothetical protein
VHQEEEKGDAPRSTVRLTLTVRGVGKGKAAIELSQASMCKVDLPVPDDFSASLH